MRQRIYSIAFAYRNEVLNCINEYGWDVSPAFLPEPIKDHKELIKKHFSSSSVEDGGSKIEGFLQDLLSDDLETRTRAIDMLVKAGAQNITGLMGAMEEWTKKNSISSEVKNSSIKFVKECVLAISYLRKAIKAYRRALALNPRHLLCNLGLAWCYEESGSMKDAISLYRRTFYLAVSDDMNRDLDPYRGGWHGLCALEAGEALQRLLPLYEKGKDNREELETIVEAVGKLRSRAQMAPRRITPLVIPIERELSYEELTAEGVHVIFDMDGKGPDVWSWVRPDVGFLVWDPKNESKVESALEMFGNVTWWVMWNNGFEPLMLLDDDGNGCLEGEELKGLAIWRDANSNAVSEEGEVIAAEQCGIVRILCIYKKRGNVIASEGGVEFSDGRTRNCYDWYAKKIVSQ